MKFTYRSLHTLAALFLISASPSYGLVAITSCTPCPPGSAASESWQTLVYSPVGRLVAAHGTCCDGSAWFKNFDITQGGEPGDNPNTSLNANIVWSGSGQLIVTANAPIDLQVVNFQTGQPVTELYHYTSVNSTMTIDVSILPPGVYGVAVYSNGSPANLFPFSTIGN